MSGERAAETLTPFADLEARRALAIGGVVPDAVVVPPTRAALAACVRDTSAAAGAIVPLGLGAHRALGHVPARYDVALSTRALAAVVDYAPADMTVTVESGVTLAALDALLAAEGQWLPLDPPLPEQTTVGGLIAADLSGPLRGSQGRVRDFVLGIAMVTADGCEVRAGGRVVKNVAGYDLMKLAIGSLGTLAVVTEATFKVRPRPQVIAVIEFAAADVGAALALAGRLADAGESALAITVLVPPDASPVVRSVLGGVAADVAAIRAEVLAAARDTGAALAYDDDGASAESRRRLAVARDLPRAVTADLVLRVTAARTRAPGVVTELLAALAGDRVQARVDTRAASVTLAIETADPRAVLACARAVAARHEAALIVERWPDALAATVDVWFPTPAALPLMRRLKDALDPGRTLAPGRFVARL